MAKLHEAVVVGEDQEKVDPRVLNPGSFNDFMEYCDWVGIKFASNIDAVNAHGEAIHAYAEALAAEKGITLEQLRSGHFNDTHSETTEEIAA